MELFWTQGYEATPVSELCEHMGLGRQSIYNAFGDKEALFSEALSRYREERLLPIISQLRAPGSGLANVHAVLDLWESGGGARGCLMANSIAEFGMREPKLSAQLGNMLGEIEEAFFHALQRAHTDGELPEGRDPRSLARLMTTLAQGLGTVGKLDPTHGLARDTVRSARTLLE